MRFGSAFCRTTDVLAVSILIKEFQLTEDQMGFIAKIPRLKALRFGVDCFLEAKDHLIREMNDKGLVYCRQSSEEHLGISLIVIHFKKAEEK